MASHTDHTDESVLQRQSDPVPIGQWRETVLLVLLGGALLLAMILPAFRSFFFSESFEYLGQYRTHSNNFWQALLSPTNEIFFRPVFFTASLPWYYLLPPDPIAYHLRNFAFSIINLLLLHRVLVRLIRLRNARVLAFLSFALSKVHLTTIGYINIFDSIILLMLLLLTLLFFLRYITYRHSLDYCAGLFFCSLSIFSKDYGFVIVGVVLALLALYGQQSNSRHHRTIRCTFQIAPLVALVPGYRGS